MIKTSKHYFKHSNKSKLKKLSVIVDEYRRVSNIILDDIWNNGYS